jgi:hypothetical protein
MLSIKSQDTEATKNEESAAPVATSALDASVSPSTLAKQTETFLTAEDSGALDAQAKENKVYSKTDASVALHPYYPQIAHAKDNKAPLKPKEESEKEVTKVLANLDIAQDSKTRVDKGKGKETGVDSGNEARTTAEKGKEKAGKAIFDDKPIPKTPMQGLKGVLEDAFIVTTVSKDTIHPFYMSLRVSITIQKKNSMPLGTSNSYLIDRQKLDGSLNHGFYDGMKKTEKNCLKSLATTVFDKNGELNHSMISDNWNDRISKGNFHTPFIHRRKGVGRRIVKAIIGEAEERGVMFCFVCPEASQQKGCPKKAPSQVNEPVIAFFKTLGFRPIGTSSCKCILTRNKTFHPT